MTTQYAGVNTSLHDFRAAMYSVLAPLFDGGLHYIGDDQKTIPAAKVVVVHKRIEPPTEMTIYIVGDAAVYDEEQYKTTDPLDATKRAIERRCKIERSVFVVTPLDELVEGKRQQDVDNVWSSLYAILATRSQQLRSLGIFYPTIPILPINIQTKSLFIEASGTLRAEIRTYFRPYTTNS